MDYSTNLLRRNFLIPPSIIALFDIEFNLNVISFTGWSCRPLTKTDITGITLSLRSLGWSVHVPGEGRLGVAAGRLLLLVSHCGLEVDGLTPPGTV